MIVYIENQKGFTEKLLIIIREFSNVAVRSIYTINCISIYQHNSENVIKENISLHNIIQKYKVSEN